MTEDGLRRARIRLASGGDDEHAAGIERMLAERGADVERVELPPALPPLDLAPLPAGIVSPGRSRRRRRLDELAWALYLAAIVLLGLALWALVFVGALAIYLGLRTVFG